MKADTRHLHGTLLPEFETRSKSVEPRKPVKRGARSLSPVTLRLTVEERAKLEELASGMTLSAYIRACLFEQEQERRKHRPKAVVADNQALAQILGLLGQSRIASNLNQLAYHANIGTLPIDDDTRAQIKEGYEHVLFMRQTLMRALGMRE